MSSFGHRTQAADCSNSKSIGGRWQVTPALGQAAIAAEPMASAPSHHKFIGLAIFWRLKGGYGYPAVIAREHCALIASVLVMELDELRFGDCWVPQKITALLIAPACH
jgi:hypothetical protein